MTLFVVAFFVVFANIVGPDVILDIAVFLLFYFYTIILKTKNVNNIKDL